MNGNDSRAKMSAPKPFAKKTTAPAPSKCGAHYRGSRAADFDDITRVQRLSDYIIKRGVLAWAGRRKMRKGRSNSGHRGLDG
jgi:hypothetical protein